MSSRKRSPARRTSGQATASRVTVETLAAYSGPIPSAFELQAYDETLPGAAERILAMAEKQSAHRQEMERRHYRGERRLSTTGQWMGYTTALGFLAVSGWLIDGGHGVEGTVIGTTDLLGLVTLFVIGRRRP